MESWVKAKMLEVLEAIRVESLELVSDPGSVCVILQHCLRSASFRFLIYEGNVLNS